MNERLIQNLATRAAAEADTEASASRHLPRLTPVHPNLRRRPTPTPERPPIEPIWRTVLDLLMRRTTTHS